ncbi:MAG: hypothetical protein KAH28_12420 [Algiphilus sp.]|nr:hypothetical protein [Algiphilus sp.]
MPASIAAGLMLNLMPPLALGSDDGDEVTDLGVAVGEFVETCYPRYREIDAAVEEAGAGEASYKKLPGFPYLRTNRMLADVLPTLSSRAEIDLWLRELRYNDAFAREIELRNLGWSESERANAMDDMRLCGVWLSAMELQKDETWQRLTRTLEYADALAKSSVQAGGSDVGDDLASKRIAAASQPSGETKKALAFWRAAPHEDTERVLAEFDELPRDRLGRVGMVSNLWKALAVHHAPRLAIASDTPSERPSRIHWKNGEMHADSGRPTVYYLPTFARVGDEMLLQFNYVMWFHEPSRQGHGGPLHGRVWRVTLDPDGRALVHETIATTGENHRWISAASDVMTEDDGGPAERAPRVAALARESRNGESPVLAASAVRETDERYALVSYDDLLFLPRGNGGTRSAFDAEGHLLKTQGGKALNQQQLQHLRVGGDAGDPAFYDAELLRRLVALARADSGR